MKVNGITYKPNCAVVCGISDEDPIFGKVKNIFIINGNRVVFEVLKLKTKGFNKHYHAFIVESTCINTTILFTKLVSPFPLHIRRIYVDCAPIYAIIMKHHITGTLSITA